MIANSPRIETRPRARNRQPDRVIGEIYLRILSRPPTEAEVATALEYARAGEVTERQAVEDLSWALINTKEFLYRH
jgi:transposase